METGRFTTLLRCNSSGCRESVIAFGTSEVSGFYDPDGAPDYVRSFRLLGMEPPPRLFELPAGTPEAVAKPIVDAFRLVFMDPAAAANRTRTAIENLLTTLGVSRRERTKTKLRIRPLHERIGLLPTRYKTYGEKLLAIKWLGNAGSHDALQTEDVFDALDIVAFVLDEIYLARRQRIAKLAKQVNSRKGPVRR